MLDCHTVIPETIVVGKCLEPGRKDLFGPGAEGFKVLPFRERIDLGSGPADNTLNPLPARFQEGNARRIGNPIRNGNDDLLSATDPDGYTPHPSAFPQGHLPEDRVDMGFFLHGAKILFSRVIPNSDYGPKPRFAWT